MIKNILQRFGRGAALSVLLASATVLPLAQAQVTSTADEVDPFASQSSDCTGPLSSTNPDCATQPDATNSGVDTGLDRPNHGSLPADPDATDGAHVPARVTNPNDIDPAYGNPRYADPRYADPRYGDSRDMNSRETNLDDAARTRQRQRTLDPRPGNTQRQPPTEFQRFVKSSTGQLLPVFGASLFDQPPSTFAPLDGIPVTSDYVIGPGDEIALRVWGQVTLNRTLTVDRNGAIYIPQAGNVNVAGLQFQQLDGYLHSQLSRVFRNFEMTVSMGQLRSIQVFVVGEAKRPGAYTVSSLSTLVNTLFASGGPGSQGSMRRIQLKRGAQTVTEFDLYDLLMRGDKSKDAHLNPGDVIYIPPAGAQIAVTGSVKTPAIYELKSESTVDDLIRMACGLTSTADTQQATIERIANHATRQSVTLTLEGQSLNTPVKDGDVLRVLPVVPRFTNTVTLRGNVANPGRFAWHEGMKLRDVIPDKDSLLTRNYWKKHNLLGYMSPLDEAPSDPSLELKRKPVANKVEAIAPEINWSYAVIERQNARDLTNQLVPFNPGKLVLDGDATENLPLEPGDVITIFSQADFQVTVTQQTRYVRLEGEFNSAGVYGVKSGETLGQLIQRAGGLSPQAYLYGAQFLRESTRKEQQSRIEQFAAESERQSQQTVSLRLANASPDEVAALSARGDAEKQRIERIRGLRATGRIVLDLDPNSNDLSKLMNLQLEDGDRFVVPPRSATVNVFGAVYNQNAFLADPQLRVRDYLEKAGGLTRTADRAHVYLIRADGSVAPRAGHDSLLGKAFDAGHLQPGDSIVVPEEVMKTTFMKGMRDWSQVITGFGLGAAAVNVLR